MRTRTSPKMTYRTLLVISSCFRAFIVVKQLLKVSQYIAGFLVLTFVLYIRNGSTRGAKDDTRCLGPVCESKTQLNNLYCRYEGNNHDNIRKEAC